MDFIKREIREKGKPCPLVFPLITMQSYGLFLEFATDTPFFNIEKSYNITLSISISVFYHYLQPQKKHLSERLVIQSSQHTQQTFCVLRLLHVHFLKLVAQTVELKGDTKTIHHMKCAHIGVKSHRALGLNAFTAQSCMCCLGTGAHQLVKLCTLLCIGDG